MGVKLLKVIPVIRGISKELSYFSSKDIRPGALVGIQLRNKDVPALVLSVQEVKETKSSLRSSPYALKRISNIKTPSIFSPEFIRAVQKSSEYFLWNTGGTIKELCPQAILQKTPITKPAARREKKEGNNTVSLLIAPHRERIKFYKNIIRSEFAQKHSIFLCLPSSGAVERYEEKLKKGIENYTLALHGGMKKKELNAKWKTALAEKHPLLILATGLFLSLPRHDINTIIIEGEGSSFYKEKNRPFLDIRTVAEQIAAEKALQIRGW